MAGLYACVSYIHTAANINHLEDERELFAPSPLCASAAALRNYSFDVGVIIHSAAYKWLQVVTYVLIAQ